MAGDLPKRARLFEFSVVAVMIVVLSAVLLEALSRVEEEAERTVVEATVRNMDSGLRLVQAQLLAQQRESLQAGLLLENPVDWLEQPPAGYVGAVEQVDPARVERGQWVWDRRALTLYYRPRRDDALKVGVGDGWLAWQVMAPDGRSEGPVGTLRIRAKFAYEWRP